MKRITTENYESFLIDHMEGKLSASLEEELNAFLLEHPSIREEFEMLSSLDDSMVKPVEEKMDFSFLKQPDSIAISDDEMIASLEGDLSVEEEKELQRKLQAYPQHQREYRLFQMSRLEPEEIFFSEKQSLKRRAATLIPMYYQWGAIAAVFMAFLLTGVIYLGSNLDPIKGTTADLGKEKSTVKNETNKQVGVSKEIASNGKVVEAMQANSSASRGDDRKIIIDEPEDVKYVNQQIMIEPKKAQMERSLKTIEKQDVYPLMAWLGPKESHRVLEEQKFLTPREWIQNQLVKQIPSPIANIKDSIMQGGLTGAGNMALSLVQQTTGLTYQEKKDEQGAFRGYALVTKYFAFERVIHSTDKN